MGKESQKTKITMEQARGMYEEKETRYQVIAPTKRHIRMFMELPTELSIMDISVFHRLCTVKHLQQYTGRLIFDATSYPSLNPKPITAKDIVQLLPIKKTSVYDSLNRLCKTGVFKRFADGYIVNPLYATASPMVYATPEHIKGKTYYNYMEGGSGIDPLLYNEFGLERMEFVELLADIPVLCVPTEKEQKSDDEIIKRALDAEKHRQDLAEGVVE